jgi:polysaccharide biosynthesis/export protein
MRRSSLLKNLLTGVIGFVIMQYMSSCATNKNMILLEGKFDTSRLSVISPVEPIIRKGDILSIIVFSDNPEATKIYNQSLIAATTSSSATNTNGVGSTGVSQTATGISPSAPGYQVDEYGDIVFQGLGKIKIEGLTKAALKDTLDARLRPYLKNPYYSIRFLNYKFTMMGEVNKPGVISIPGERINILEAIAMAGDLTVYARRDSVFIIRENNNKREFARLDLRKPETLASPYFYLQQNDILIFEPTKKKAAASDVVTARNISIALAFVSTFAIVYSLFRK